MDNALRLAALAAAQGLGFDQQGAEALLLQARVQPEAGDAAAQNTDIGVQGCAHGLRNMTGKRVSSIAVCDRPGHFEASRERSRALGTSNLLGTSSTRSMSGGMHKHRATARHVRAGARTSRGLLLLLYAA